MVQSHGCLHLVPPLPARAASAVPFLTAILQERGIFQPEPVVPRSSPHRFHQRIPLNRVCCSCLSPLWHAAILRLGPGGCQREGAVDLLGRPTPCNRERVSASYHWRFPGLIAAPPRLHGLGSASSFRGAGAIVRFGWAGVNGS